MSPLLFLCGFFLCFLSVFSGRAETAYWEVNDLRPGMKGVTYTVLQGTKIEPIETEVLGVAKGMSGPGMDLIICKLVDPKTALTEAVHGMSGSPLYIEGKLVGALSRRIGVFEKDGHCGFTPIRDMLRVDAQAREVRPESPTVATTQPWDFFKGTKLAHLAEPKAERLALPLTISGLGEGLAREIWNGWGGGKEDLVVVPGGSSTALALGPEELQPGSALAVIFMTGDISMAGTGTLTWREGNRILGFGHSMFGIGESAWPCGPAEIITTVPSYAYPYKLANPGRVFGTISQDRLSAVAGTVGVRPKMAQYRVTRTHNGEPRKTMEGEFVSSPTMALLLMSAAIASGLEQSNDAGRIFSLRVSGTVKFQGLPPLQLSGIYSGQDFDLPVALSDVMQPLRLVYGQDWVEPVVEDLQVQIATTEAQAVWTIQDIRARKIKVEAGEAVDLTVDLEERYGQKQEQKFSFKLPENLKSGSVEIRVAGADALDRSEFFRSAQALRNASQLIDRLNQQRTQNRIYVQVLTSGFGQAVDQHDLPSLPSSVRTVMEAAHSTADRVLLNEEVWLEQSAELPGVVSGLERLRLEIR